MDRSEANEILAPKMGRAWRSEKGLGERARAVGRIAETHYDVVGAVEVEDAVLESEAIPDVLPPRVVGQDGYFHPSYRKVFRRGWFTLSRYDARYKGLLGVEPREPRELRAALLAEYFVWYIEPRATRPKEWPEDEMQFVTAWGCSVTLLRSVLRACHFDSLLERYRPLLDVRERIWQVDDALFERVMEGARLPVGQTPGWWVSAVGKFYERVGLISKGVKIGQAVLVNEKGSEAEEADMGARMRRLLPYAQKLGLIEGGEGGGTQGGQEAHGPAGVDAPAPERERPGEVPAEPDGLRRS